MKFNKAQQAELINIIDKYLGKSSEEFVIEDEEFLETLIIEFQEHQKGYEELAKALYEKAKEFGAYK